MWLNSDDDGAAQAGVKMKLSYFRILHWDTELIKCKKMSLDGLVFNIEGE